MMAFVVSVAILAALAVMFWAGWGAAMRRTEPERRQWAEWASEQDRARAALASMSRRDRRSAHRALWSGLPK